MPVRYAGVDLTPPPGPWFFDPYFWQASRIEEFEFPGFAPPVGMDHLPLRDAPARKCPQIGTLHWPSGASRWGLCHLVATAAQVTSVIRATGASPVAKTLQMTDGVRTISTDMWMLPPRPIFQKGGADMYLITLVDERYWWWQEGAESSPSTAPSSWSNLLTTLFTSVGAAPTLPAVAAGYSTPSPIRWTVGFKPLPILLDSAAMSCGLRIFRRLDGSTKVQTYALAATDDTLNWTTYQNYVMSGGRVSISDIARALPEAVAVVFWGYDPVATSVTLASLALTEYTGMTAVPGRSAQIVADIPAVSAGATRTAYATQAATDYYLWALSRSDVMLRGLHEWPMTGLDHVVEWIHEPSQILTRVNRRILADNNLYGDAPPLIRFPARITGAYNAVTGYPWERLTLNTATPGYAVASPAKTGNKLFEVSGSTSLSVGARVLVWSNPDGDGWECQAGGAGSAYSIIQDEGVDLPAESKLNFKGDGVEATDDAANNRTNVTVYDASDTQTGCVNLAAFQYMGDGDKYFQTSVYVNTSHVDSSIFYFGQTGAVSTADAPIYVQPKVAASVDIDDRAIVAFGAWEAPPPPVATKIHIWPSESGVSSPAGADVTVRGAVCLLNYLYLADATNNAGYCSVEYDGVDMTLNTNLTTATLTSGIGTSELDLSGSIDARYSCRGLAGVSGTLTQGNVITGGIVTDLGTGGLSGTYSLWLAPGVWMDFTFTDGWLTDVSPSPPPP